ncbi:MAG: sulfate ABC transporter substrate-binding protein, partial [Gaiellaceae bacterium]
MAQRTRIALRAVPAALATLLLALAAAGCGGGDTAGASGGNRGTLSLVAYSTPREAYEEIIPAFQETDAGAGIDFDQSYASSGEQSRAVESGLAADVVAFSLEPDVTRLIEAGLVDADWNQDDYDGMVTDSVVVFMVREGNPEGIQTWDDLLRDGVEVITPNPFTSGGAQWNIMAAYGAQLEQGKSEEEAVDYLRELFLEHVPVQDKSARESLQTFAAGKGDVLLAYENEAIFAQQAGQPFEYVVPDETILIENPVAVVNSSEKSAAARAFVDYLRSPDAQRVFGEKGYRPVVEDVLAEFDYPTPPGLFTIADLGGWTDVRTRFFDREESIFLDIENELGVST